MAEDGPLMWKDEGLIHIGAEATVHAGKWLGFDAVLKTRNPRAYRHPDLDSRLTRSRMSAEARILRRLAQAELPVPDLLALDTNAAWLICSRVPGAPLFEALRADLSGKAAQEVLGEVGLLIRKMHGIGISHGDLTTHNILWCPEQGLSIIDFGLSAIAEEVETFGLDLQVLNECLSASHPSIESGTESVLKGYLSASEAEEKASIRLRGSAASVLPSANEIAKRFGEIRSRVRYHG